MKLIKLNLGTVITSLLLLPFLNNPAAAEEINDAASSDARPVSLLQVGESMTPARRIILRHDPSYISTLRVPPPLELALQQQGLMAAQATITVNFLPAGVVGGDNCLTWPEQPKAAFSYAANLWASQLQSPAPITIDACWANNLPAGVLGHGGANNFIRNFSGAPVTNTWYAVPVANALHGSDLDPAQSDIYSAYSSTFNWYFGTDGNTPPGQVDFASVVLHEITHGLGFLGSMQVSGGQGSWGLGTPYPIIYDLFTENGSGQKLLNTALFPNPSAVLATQLTSNDLYFDGANANAGNGGARVPLYAPATWSPGSSYAHLAESYNNTPNALMTYSLPSGESTHSPGPVTLGLLKDTGWTLQQASNNYTLTLAKAGTGNGTVGGGGSYPAGATVTLTATPNAESIFAGWNPSPCAPSFTMPANNLACTAIFNLSQSALPDLVVTSVTGPNSAIAGSNIPVTATIKNQGTATASAGSMWQVSFWLGSTSNSGLGCYTSLNLAPGASTTCSDTFTINANVAPGVYNLRAFADPFDVIGESNETNNWLTATNTITITGGGGPTTYTLTLTKTGSGSGTVGGGGNYAAGAPVTLTATPDAGSTFAGWSPSPCAASFAMPASNLTCTATFSAVGAPTAAKTIGLYNPATSFFFLRNSNTQGIADLTFNYGPPGAGWLPIVGDWNGDGTATIGLYNPATSFFFLRNGNTQGIADLTFSYGPPGAGWIPVAGDWNGDGTATIGLYNPATSFFFLRNSNTQGIADLTFNYGPPGAGWKPLAGDWNGPGL
ncbi:MAG: hypothetical protein F9K25_02540 [Candidatus Contendobacter sp.]|nr:MAG: hypothetical protein F9K25_02540 [Candidatus Contendobacter sp.]